jgi:DNA-binding NarL/FixJ family response regulator
MLPARLLAGQRRRSAPLSDNAEVASAVKLGRRAFTRREWSEAYSLLAAAESLDAADLECLAVAAHLVGKDDESARAWERAHLACIDSSEPERAARCAAWLGLTFLMRGETARASGWFGRAERLAGNTADESAARGFLLVPEVLGSLMGGDPAAAHTRAAEIIDIADRARDPDLLALGVLGRGQACIALGDMGRGMQFLDEVMVSVTSGEVSPILAGIVYCAVIEACMDALDLRRAAEWTDALYDWCSSQPDLVPFRGQCLVHRSQVLQAHGAWAEAVSELERASRELSRPPVPALGFALYQQGELHRLRGQHRDAERAYREARSYGHDPTPGFALLRLAEGHLDAAVASVRRMAEESRGLANRPMILAAAVEVLLAGGDLDAARTASGELAELARADTAGLLRAVAEYATGCVLLAQHDVGEALTQLRRACATWRDLDLPYDVARAELQIAIACRALGDQDAADSALGAARATFERLGAEPDLARVDDLIAADKTDRPSVLTEREHQVLRLVAAGKTNREIASELVISQHTVARHLQNIFMKLGLSSRSAATAYAYEHGLA